MFSDEKSVAHLPKSNRGLMTKGLRISFAIDDPVEYGKYCDMAYNAFF